jgi:hypothetical protein
MKDALAERWIDQRAAGGYNGATYRAVAILHRHSGSVRSVGVVQREGVETTSYQVRVDVHRRMRAASEAPSRYDVIMKAPAGEAKHNADDPFIESSYTDD